ncbi:hypothetical protein RJT34_29777 [Clitoria ternatea]|uniref:Uncharacterized protein n=1 Tax=Clitoria ternatea TaxID=43366 RepID=A0AAN9ER77_CLITE
MSKEHFPLLTSLEQTKPFLSISVLSIISISTRVIFFPFLLLLLLRSHLPISKKPHNIRVQHGSNFFLRTLTMI